MSISNSGRWFILNEFCVALLEWLWFVSFTCSPPWCWKVFLLLLLLHQIKHSLPNNKAEKRFTCDRIRNTINHIRHNYSVNAQNTTAQTVGQAVFGSIYFRKKQFHTHKWIVLCGITIQCQMQFIQRLSFKSTAFIYKKLLTTILS